MLKYLLVVFITCQSFIWANSIEFIGIATDIETGEVLYQENHKVNVDASRQPQQAIVEYIDPRGELLGRKTLNYKNATAPTYEVEFFHVSRAETVDINKDELLINILKDEKNTREIVNTPDSPFVIDGGFHYFIQQNFTSLLNGNSFNFEFLSAPRGTFIPLTIKPTDSSESTITLELRLKNFFLAQLVKPIELTYHKDTTQLLSYKGLTNVPNQNGKAITALITYQYPVNLAQLPVSISP